MAQTTKNHPVGKRGCCRIAGPILAAFAMSASAAALFWRTICARCAAAAERIATAAAHRNCVDGGHREECMEVAAEMGKILAAIKNGKLQLLYLGELWLRVWCLSKGATRVGGLVSVECK